MVDKKNYLKGKELIFYLVNLEGDGWVHALWKLWMCNYSQDITIIGSSRFYG